MHQGTVNKLGLFIRAIAAGETEFRTFTGEDNKKTHSYVTPVAANGHFGDVVQKVVGEGDLSDRRGNPIRRYKAGDIVEGELEPRYHKEGRAVERWTYTTAKEPLAVGSAEPDASGKKK